MQKKKRLSAVGLVVFSMFIIWHLIGISVVGPLYHRDPESLLNKIYSSYLSFLQLNRAWPFYAPNPQLGIVMRYETVDDQGKVKTHLLTEAYGRHEHAYARYSNVFVYLFEYPDYTRQQGFDKSVARYLCGIHSGEGVKHINFIIINQKKFTHLDFNKGKQPLDPEFVERQEFGPYPCEQAPDSKGMQNPS